MGQTPADLRDNLIGQRCKVIKHTDCEPGAIGEILVRELLLAAVLCWLCWLLLRGGWSWAPWPCSG